MSDNSYCIIKEGQFRLPENFVDRSINVIADMTASRPSINISRDTLGANASSLEEYVNQQLSILISKLTGWHEKPRKPVYLGTTAISGEEINYNFLRQPNQRMWQKQAVFLLNKTDILIFTMSKLDAFNEQDDALLNEVLQSFALKE